MADQTDVPRDPIEEANRARLAELHQLRSATPADVHDAFLGWFWVLFVFLAVGVATNLLIDLRIAWAAAAGLAVNLIGISVFLGLLERHENKLMRECEGSIVDAPPRPRFDWRSMTPPRIVRRIRAHLDALDIDDSDLEDALDVLVRQGCDSYDLRPTGQRFGRTRRPPTASEPRD